MIKFGYKDYEDEFPDWTKHHKQIGVCIKRVYANGRSFDAKYENLKKIADETPELLKSKMVYLRDNETLEQITATDYFLVLDNLQYEETNVDYYDIGSMNTKQTTYIRLKFMIEQHQFFLEYSFKSAGSHAMSFSDVICDIESIEDIIEEILEHSTDLPSSGISKADDDDYDFRICVLDEVLSPYDLDIRKNDLIKHLVGIEVYKFEHEITNERS